MSAPAAAALSSLLWMLGTQAVQWQHLPPALQSRMPGGETQFEALRSKLNARTADRVRRGEDEHLIYYVLQSTSFTTRPALEPALLAKDSPDPTPAARLRMQEFLAALPRRTRDERLQWFQKHLPQDRRTEPALFEAYGEAMRFLREKEFGAGGPEVYRSRGHSSDTSLAPAYSVWHALAIIAGLEKSALFNRVLLIGPGVDFAARTGFRDAVPPQSYQPLLTAHSMLQHRLSDPGRLAVTCVDVNPRVLAFALLRNQVTLPAETGNKAFTEWLRDLGPTLQVEQPVYENMRCRQLNIITERIADETFDIVIATNVLLYFDDVELPLSLANIAAMLRPGGYFVHNELRPDVEVIARALKLPMIQGRTIDIATGARRALRDAIVIHQKKR